MRRISMLAFLFVVGLSAQDANKSEKKSNPTSALEKHFLKPSEGKAMIEAFHSKRKALLSKPAETSQDLHHVDYPAAAIKRLLSQKGAITFRVYPALNGDAQTFVLAAVDSNGNMLDSATNFVVDVGEPCPPFCKPTDPPNQ